MKHLYILNSASLGGYYGIGTYIEQLIAYATSNITHITVVELYSEISEFSIVFKDGIRYIYIPSPSFIKNVSNDEFMQCENIMQNNAVLLLQDHINVEDENIFHLNRMNFGTLARGLKHKFNGRVILTVHYTEWSFNLLGDKDLLLEFLASKEEKDVNIYNNLGLKIKNEQELMNAYCDKIIAISKHSYNDLIDIYKVDPEKITIINNALNDFRPIRNNRLQIRTRFNIKDDEIIVMYAGRLDEIKGVEILIDAFKLLLVKHSNCRLLIAGGGNIENLVSKSAPEWLKISYTGYVSKKMLSQLYSIADIGVVPSLHEEFGYVAIEMMMHKLPIIVNNTTGLAEIVENGLNGLYVNINNNEAHKKNSIKELAGKISYLISETEYRTKLGANARKTYLKNYNIKQFQGKMTEIYDSTY